MLSDVSKRILGLIAMVLLATFVLGLAYSISTGFAGFWGGLPFWVITLFVLSMAVYNYWEETLRKK